MLRMLCLTLTLSYVSCKNSAWGDTNRPVDCEYGPWSEYKPSSNENEVERTREIRIQAKNGGQPCTGSTIEIRQKESLQTPSVYKFVPQFSYGDRRKVFLRVKDKENQTYTFTRDVVVALDTTLFGPLVTVYKSIASILIGSVCAGVGRNYKQNIISLITYDSENVTVFHSFSDEQSSLAIEESILRIQYRNRSSNPSLVGRAMEAAKLEVSSYASGTRPYHLSHKDVLLFVTYRDLCDDNDVLYSRQLKIAARVYVIVLGDSSDGSPSPSDWCLRKFASDQFDTHFLHLRSVEDYKKLFSVVTVVKEDEHHCKLH